MPSTTHDGLVRLFDGRPELAAELLRGWLRLPLPRFRRARVEKESLTQVRSVEFHADLVVSYSDVAPVFAVIVEVQLKPDWRKRYSWPVYVPSVRARLKCPVVLLVVTPSTSVERWARRPIVVGPGTQCTPVVLGPAGVPAVTEIRDATRNPELAVLSAMAHGKGDRQRALRIAKAAAAGVVRLDEDTALIYFAAIREALGPAARKAFEMDSDVERLFDPKTRRKIRAARAQGRAEGKAEALRAKRDAILVVLRTRGLRVTERQRARIAACTDVPTLDLWLRRAASASSLTAVFEARSSGTTVRPSSAASSRRRR